ncbi:MAG: hypothetical protein DME25_05650 [Verrucomicrobia bacterium]|nr:MAG: hypothetical protein DME25_05650 [Verrucomicrobiota bacterium]
MRGSPKSKGQGPKLRERVSCSAFRDSGRGSRSMLHGTRNTEHAFTLIEIMVVIGIMALLMAISVPFAYKVFHKEALRQAVSDIVEVCSHARAQAIMQGAVTEVVFHPKEKRLEVSGGSRSGPARGGPDAGANPYHVYNGGAEVKPEAVVAVGGSSASGGNPAAPPGSGLSAQVPDSIVLEALGINLMDYTDADVARVRFYPNGTCDEMLLILRSDRNEQRGISLEVTTGLATMMVESDLQKLRDRLR